MTMKIIQTFGRGYFDHTHPDSKTSDAIKVLIANQVFQKEITQLRNKWSGGEYQAMLDAELAKERTRVARFNKHLRPHRRSHRLPTSLSRPPSGSVFYSDILTLMQHFKLRKKLWIRFLWRYINNGKYDAADVPSETAPLVHLARDEETGETKILIEIAENTTVNELKETWRRVDGLRKRIFPDRKKYKPQKNFERDRKIYSLYEKGLTIAEISTQMFKEDHADLDYGNIKKIVTTYRKKLGLPKSGKLVTHRFDKDT